jgi:NADH dehydrogenase/NADH:ubiquinone oxidoreductase subunit G
MADKMKVTIDGHSIEVEAGTTMLLLKAKRQWW